MRFLFALTLIVTFLNITAEAQATSRKGQSPLRQQLAELNRAFTYKGKALHPRAIKDLCSWVADPLPGPIAIDVEGTFETNRYFGDYETRKNKFIYIDLTQTSIEDLGWFSYEHLGRLANGYHVLHTVENSGGTGIFEGVLLVEFLIDYEYDDTGIRKQQLVMRRRGQYGVGDRYDGEIRLDLKHNTIFIGADKRNVEKAYRITIR